MSISSRMFGLAYMQLKLAVYMYRCQSDGGDSLQNQSSEAKYVMLRLVERN